MLFRFVLLVNLCAITLVHFAQGQMDSEAQDIPLFIQSASLNPTSGTTDQPRELKLHLSLKPGFKAYLDKFKLTILDPYPTKQSTLNLNPTYEFFDKFSKTTKQGVKETATLATTVEFHQPLEVGHHQLKLELSFQACSESVCYFPQTIQKDVVFDIQGDTTLTKSETESKSLLEENFSSAQKRGLPYLFIFVFLAGVLTSLTPCLLPMLPITVAVIGKGHSHDDKLKKFINAVIYVLGVATTYSLLGLLAASSGALFGNILSNIWTQIGFGIAFVFMGFAQFGFFEFQTPLWLQNHFHKLGRNASGIFVSGLISGLIASPCVGPVLVGILTFIAKTQDLVLGFGLMFAYALGLGQLLIVLGVSTSLLYKFPRSPWIMKASKSILGFALIASGLFYLSLVWPKLNGNNKVSASAEVSNSTSKKTSFLPWKTYSPAIFNEALRSGKPFLIDFYADWCLACHELDEKTFSSPEAEEALKHFLLIRFDATNESDELVEVRKKFQIVGLPTVLFFNAKGKWLSDLTLNEFEPMEKFRLRLQKVQP